MNLFNGVMCFILGSVLASFYGVMAERLPLGKSIVKPRSHCDYCNHPLAFYELVPIFSYLFLKGKCSSCHHKLPKTMLITEIFLGLSFSLSYFYYGFSYYFLISLFLFSLFDLIFLTDIKYMIILDSPLFVSAVGIFLLQWFFYGLSFALSRILAGVILFFFMFFIGLLGKFLFKREALGGGDIKLSFLFGLILGLPHGLMALILSTFLALPYATFTLYSSHTKELPYGPFLISALCLVFFFYDKFSWFLDFLFQVRF